jgi:hypothetical protein
LQEVLKPRIFVFRVLWEASYKKATSNSATESAVAAAAADSEMDSEDVLIVDAEPLSVDVVRFELILKLVEFLTDQNEILLPFKEFIRIFSKFSISDAHNMFHDACTA